MSVLSTVKDRTSYDAVKDYDFKEIVYDVEGNAYDAKIKKYRLNDKIVVEKIEVQTPYVDPIKRGIDSLVFGKKRFDVEGKVQPSLIEKALANWTTSETTLIPDSLKKPSNPFDRWPGWPDNVKPTPPSSVRFNLTPAPAAPKTPAAPLPRWSDYNPMQEG